MRIEDIVEHGDPDYETTQQIVLAIIETIGRHTFHMQKKDQIRFAIGALNTALTMGMAGIKPSVRLEAFDKMVAHMRANIEAQLKDQEIKGNG